MDSIYTSYRAYAACYRTKEHRLECFHQERPGCIASIVIEEVRLNGEKVFDLSDFALVAATVESLFSEQRLVAKYSGGPEAQSEMTVSVRVSALGIELLLGINGHLDVVFQGELYFGEDTFAGALDRRGTDLRCAYGPAAQCGDNVLFDRQSDSALEILGIPDTRLHYDWGKKLYTLCMRTGGDDITRGFCVRVHKDLYKRKFSIPYAPVNKSSVFSTPPVGWMTWYAVQFAAGEKTVLDNVRVQKEKLAPYGANAVWVDWEWYHNDFSGTHTSGINTFHPDPNKYPHGLAPVAKAIEQMGFVPALWIGATNDPDENEFFAEHPEVVITNKRAWCGRYFIDPTHPLVQGEYIPRVFNQILDWGYKALKWDCLPVSMEYWDRNHDRFYDASVSTDQALRQITTIARNVVGPDFYMLSCSGNTLRDIGCCADIYDAARIGGDIFRWSEFVHQCVERVAKLYALHNVVIYCDPDNVVLREKYNSIEQARSRASLVGILGLPYTFGDDLTELPEERIELIRRTIPPLDIHPMDIRENLLNRDTQIIHLSVEMPWESWSVVDVMNLTQTTQRVRVSLAEDLHLDEGKYLVFDYWNQSFLGYAERGFMLELNACASRVLSIRRVLDRPQILSTTRHISQGALELENVFYDAQSMTLSGASKVVGQDDYAIYFHVPANLRPFRECNATTFFEIERIDVSEDLFFESQCPHGSVWKMPIRRDVNETVQWAVGFTTCHPAYDDMRIPADLNGKTGNT
ncbi:MAG: glycoside hydrolase family 36 protein [Christensenellaceae bacterium]|nr:glycoside hydrolase family 36 protein [Christensenellaceae bacterium]